MTQRKVKENAIDGAILKFISQTIKKFFPEGKVKVYVFGSRARGDFGPKSDYDLAFELPPGKTDAGFLLTIKEEAPTLCGVDAVNMNQVGEKLKKEILRERILIYET